MLVNFYGFTNISHSGKEKSHYYYFCCLHYFSAWVIILHILHSVFIPFTGGRPWFFECGRSSCHSIS